MKGFCLEVSGPYACFTRPEMKVERVSYDVITPSAARAIFDAILWKPALRWRITLIEVLAPIHWISMRRNEVGEIAKPRAALYIEDKRQQRAGLFLRDVKYRLHAEFDFIPPERRPSPVNRIPEWFTVREEAEQPHSGAETEAKYAAMFERRASKGQRFHQPYLGCREFACDYWLVESGELSAQRIQESRDLGWMLYDLDYSNPADPQAMFFRAEMKDGVVAVPHPDSEEVRR